MTRDKPWIFRTYAGHSSATASNTLYRTNLAKGQTGLSVAFDLPTQTGYDSDDPLAKGEVGKVGVPVSHIGDMRALFDSIPLKDMNTSMTINAPAAWLLALYVAVADEQGAPRASLTGTTQNDIIKEYLARGTYIFPPKPALRLTTDTIAFTTAEMPKWNPINLCSYHLQEAGADAVEEAAFALAAAVSVLDAARARGAIPPAEFPKAVGRMSFFVNSGVKFITEICKLRAMGALWDEITRDRYGVTDPKLRLFRYGVQVNSLGLTEQQPENNVYRVLFGMLGVTLSKNARARAVQLPAWNEALGLPRPWDQQWSLRLMQIGAFETDMLEYGDIFDGSKAIEEKVNQLKVQIREEMDRIAKLGGAATQEALEYMKERLVASNAARVEAIERGDEIRVGVNAYQETEVSPLTTGTGHFMTVDESAESVQIARIKAWRAARDNRKVEVALAALERAAREDT
ncbi:MAG: methylmalonyl-CoA mutase family protein, partial [Rhizomicrobium sp.]